MLSVEISVGNIDTFTLPKHPLTPIDCDRGDLVPISTEQIEIQTFMAIPSVPPPIAP